MKEEQTGDSSDTEGYRKNRWGTLQILKDEHTGDSSDTEQEQTGDSSDTEG